MKHTVPSLGLTTYMLWDCSTTCKPLFKSKYHYVDLLWVNHRKWWQLPIVGIQFWSKTDPNAIPSIIILKDENDEQDC